VAEHYLTTGGTRNILMKDVMGKHVVTRKEMTTRGGITIPAGTRLKVVSAYRSEYHLQGPKCEHCGISARIRCHRNDIEVDPANFS